VLEHLDRALEAYAILVGQLAELHAVPETWPDKGGLTFRDECLSSRKLDLDRENLPSMRSLVDGVDETSADTQIVDVQWHVDQSGTTAVEGPQDPNVLATVVEIRHTTLLVIFRIIRDRASREIAKLRVSLFFGPWASRRYSPGYRVTAEPWRRR
jgi:hypothetical protein